MSKLGNYVLCIIILLGNIELTRFIYLQNVFFLNSLPTKLILCEGKVFLYENCFNNPGVMGVLAHVTVDSCNFRNVL